MNDTDKIKLEAIIKILSNSIRQPGAYIAESQKIAKSNDEQELKDNIMAADILMSFQDDATVRMLKLLIGTNILTPSLTTKGWKFWKSPPLKNKQKRNIENLVTSWTENKQTKAEGLVEELKTGELAKRFNIEPTDRLHIQEIYLSSAMEIISECNRQFIKDLKVILDNPNSA